MNTDRTCEVKDTPLINCEWKDTLLNTDELHIQGHICEHWNCKIMDIYSQTLINCVSVELW